MDATLEETKMSQTDEQRGIFEMDESFCAIPPASMSNYTRPISKPYNTLVEITGGGCAAMKSQAKDWPNRGWRRLHIPILHTPNNIVR